MVRRNNLAANIDWLTVIIWLVMILFGWMNIYSANFIREDAGQTFDFTQRYGRQLIWIGAAVVLAIIIILLDKKFYFFFAYLLYGIVIAILLGVLVFGREVNGAKSWFAIGSFQLQPSEFAKPLTALALAKYLSGYNFSMKRTRDLLLAFGIIFLPAVLILLQPDAGSTLVFAAFVAVLYREGFSPVIMLLFVLLGALFFLTLIYDKIYILYGLVVTGLVIHRILSGSNRTSLSLTALFGGGFAAIYLVQRFLWPGIPVFLVATVLTLAVVLSLGAILVQKRQYSYLKIIGGFLVAYLFVISVDFGFHKVLKIHQQHRISVTLGIEDDPQGVGYNVNQSKIAIGSGGFSGKGYLNGTQTKLHFVPEQSTDFIFCTVGEEWGFLGTAFVLLLYLGLLVRLITLADRQRSSFSRIFGYGLAVVLLTHLVVNIGMTIGLLPVIGIPLPFFSYGGSSLWAFTLFLFIFLRLDANRTDLL
ncbi:MAG: rod shape-determining protein RodA [Bacteroidota bacterium]